MAHTHWNSEKIRQYDAKYYVIFGERSNGKTFDVLYNALLDYKKTKRTLAIIRRWDEDFSGQNSARTCYNSLMCDGNGKNRVKEIFAGEFTGVEYYGGRYFLTKYDDATNRDVRTDIIIAYGFSINSSEHYKSGSYPDVGTILFDEFIATKTYLVDEFVLFCNLLSTIIRTRDDITVWLCGNTINKYNPYFTEMGLYKAKDMKPGDTDLYEYGESGLKVAVCFSDSPAKKKKSDVYFAFANPKLQMITKGGWELDIYPHSPCKWKPKDIIFSYFIIFDGEKFQADIVSIDYSTFTFIHRKSTPIKDDDVDLVYSQNWDIRPNHRRKITSPVYDVEKRIVWFFHNDKVFYQDNAVGDTIRAYLDWCVEN